MAFVHTFGAAARTSVIPAGRYFAVGIANGSDHGMLIANGQPIGPGSPLLLDPERTAAIALRAISHHPGDAGVVVATCAAELAALMRPRPPIEREDSDGLTEDQSLILDVPFHGRSKLAALIRITSEAGDTHDIDIVTQAGFYYAANGLYPDLDGVQFLPLNSYDETNLTAYEDDGDNPVGYGALLAIHETERCDVLRVKVTTNDTLINAFLRAQAFDEGT